MGLLAFPAPHSLVRGTAGHVIRTDSFVAVAMVSGNSLDLVDEQRRLRLHCPGWWLWAWQAHSRLRLYNMVTDQTVPRQKAGSDLQMA